MAQHIGIKTTLKYNGFFGTAVAEMHIKIHIIIISSI